MNTTGLLAGAVGTAVLSMFECIESVALGHRLPVYAAANVGGALARRWFPGVARSRSEMRFGYLIRALYGPSLGALFMHLRARLPRAPIIAGVCFAAGVFACELALMPRVAATPPARTWRQAERWLLFLHTAVFGVTTALTARSLTPKRSGDLKRSRLQGAGRKIPITCASISPSSRRPKARDAMRPSRSMK